MNFWASDFWASSFWSSNFWAGAGVDPPTDPGGSGIPARITGRIALEPEDEPRRRRSDETALLLALLEL